jgi:MFS family permease
MPKDPTETGPLSTGRRWLVVIVSLGVTASSFLFINGVPFVFPALEAAGTPLTQAGLLASMPSWGMVVTLVAWGYVLDRVGERIVLTVGSALTAAAGYGAASAHSLLLMAAFLFLGGMAAASCNSAGGRLVSGWFPPQQRGLVMGIRQTAQPLGIALGALVIPELAEDGGVHAGLMFPAIACGVSALVAVIGVRDPPRKSRKTATERELASPYRGSAVLWRIHTVSALLMMPQTVTVTFMLLWLMKHHGWSVAAAGGLVTISQLLGAVGRIAVGRWSDRVGSRMRPVRIIAIAATATLFLLAVTDDIGSRYDISLMVAISVIAVLDNGLEATAITEYAGPFWSGRALGTQNTTQRLSAAAGPPLFGALITAAAYPQAWALCGLFPLLAIPLVPARVLPPGLEARARLQSVRRLRLWRAVRPRDLPDKPRRPDPPAQPALPRQDGPAATPPT